MTDGGDVEHHSIVIVNVARHGIRAGGGFAEQRAALEYFQLSDVE